jgi:acetoin utilization protein AcuB
MLARDLISDIIPAVKTSDTGAQVLSWMEHFKVSHMPIVNNESFLGLVSEDDIYSLDDPNTPIGNHPLSLFSPFVTVNQHIFEVIDIIKRLKISVVPVLAGDNVYKGCITLHTLVAQFAKLSSADQPGAVIILKMTVHDYTLTQIARIVEENQAKILSSYVMSVPDTTEIHVTLKLSTNELTSIIRTFERYDYNIEAVYMENEEIEDFYKMRYEEFMRYLNI